MDLQLEGRTVWVTGASGGIGRALAAAFAAEGCRLALMAGRRLDGLQAWVAEQPWADRAACAAADVRDPIAVERALAKLSDAVGTPHHAVVNAGIWPEASVDLRETPVDRIRHVVDVDLLGALWSARAFLAQASAADLEGTSLTFIGSTAGAFGEAGHVAYAASKAALRGVVASLKNEVVRTDPCGRVNLVEPGWTDTPMAAGAMDDAVQVARSVSTTPLRKVGRPQDVADACVFLASPRAGHLTGQVVGVHGGMEGRRLW